MDISFQFNTLNLKNTTKISFAKYLWSLPAVKNQIKRCFRDYNGHKVRYEHWHPITLKLIDYYKLIPIQMPPTLEAELLEVISNIGEKIFNWLEYFTTFMGFNILHAKEIHFTRYGTVDEKKTFNTLLERDFGSHNFNSRNAVTKRLFLFSCVFAQEDFISENCLKMLSSAECQKMDIYFPNWDDYFFMAISLWIFKRFSSEEYKSLVNNAAEERHLLTGRFIGTQEMLDICSEAGLYEAARYFLINFDDDEEDDKNLLEPAENCFKNLKSLPKTKNHEQEKRIELILYLLDEMSENDRFSIISKHKIDFLKLFLTWPFDEFYADVLEKILNNLTNDECKSLIEMIADFIITDLKSQCPIKKIKYKQILQMTWYRISKPKKIFIFENSKIFSKLLHTSNFSSLKGLLNVENLPNKEKLLKTDICKEIKGWLKKGENDLFNRFLEESFDTDEEREKFKGLLEIH